MTLSRCALLLLAAGAPAKVWASSDGQSWVTVGVNARLSDKWRLSQDVVARFSDRRNGLYEVESSTLLGYRISKTVTVAAGYVHNPQYSDGDFTVMEHRAREQVSVDNVGQIGAGWISGRLRFEQRWRDGLEDVGWRLRPYAKFALPVNGKTSVNFSNELFVNLNRTAFQQTAGLDRMRNLVSISTPLSGKLTGEAGYMSQYGFVRGGPDTTDHAAYFALSLNI
jgi:hypothetical protein